MAWCIYYVGSRNFIKSKFGVEKQEQSLLLDIKKGTLICSYPVYADCLIMRLAQGYNYDYSPLAICICGPLEDKVVTYDIERAI